MVDNVIVSEGVLLLPNGIAIEGLLTIEYCLTGNIQLQFTTGNWPYPLRSGFGRDREGRCGQWKRYVAGKEVLDSSQLSQLAVGGRVEVVEPENFEPPYIKIASLPPSQGASGESARRC